MSLNPIARIRHACAASLIEREADVDAVLLGLVAREHVLLVGPPGTAKSHTVRSVAACVSGAVYFERLLSPTTPPDAIWGPVDIEAYKRGVYAHKSGTVSLQTADIVYLDEIGRASPAIADSLLHAMGPERQALVGEAQIRLPMRSCVGSSNTWPDAPESHAWLDRWLIRREVRSLSPTGQSTLVRACFPAPVAAASLADIDDAAKAADATPVSPEAYDAYDQILSKLVAEGVRPSDRRVRASVRVARAAAVIDGDAAVKPHHLECLRDVLWDSPLAATRQKTAEIVVGIANPTAAKIEGIMASVVEIIRDVQTDSASRMAAAKKLEASEKEAQALLATGNGRAKALVAHIQYERVKIQAAILGLDPAKAAVLLGVKS